MKYIARVSFMTIWLCVSVFTGISVIAVITGIDAQSQAVAMPKVQEIKSPMGVEAWFVENHDLPIVTIQMAWRGGAAQDPEGLAGLASLMGSLMNEGAGERTSLAFQQALADIGTQLYFEASMDHVTASLSFLSDYGDRAAELSRDALIAPRFDEEAIARMRAETKAALANQKQSPSRTAMTLWYQNAFAGHPYGRPKLGDEDSLDRIQRDDLIKLHTNMLARDNLLISVVGDISADDLGKLLDRIFADIPKTANLQPIEPVALKATPVSMVSKRIGPQTSAVFGHAGIGYDDPDFFPAYVMNYTLGGGGFSSRLVNEIREKRGLAYSIYSYLLPLDKTAIWIGALASDNQTIRPAIELVRNEMRHIRDQGVNEQELNAAKTYLTGSYALRFDSRGKIANQMLGAQMQGWPSDYFETRNQRILNVTQDDIKRAASRVLLPEALMVQMVGDPSDEATSPNSNR
jgi:zinc protease